MTMYGLYVAPTDHGVPWCAVDGPKRAVRVPENAKWHRTAIVFP